MVFAHGFGCDQNMWRFVCAGVRGRPPRRAVRPRRRRRLGRVGLRPRALRLAATATPTTCWRSAASSTCSDVVFVGHSVSAMIGVLAAVARARALRRLVLVGPSPRYIDDDGYVGGFSARGHRGAARLAGQQLPRLVERDGAGDHGQPRPARAGRGADQQLLPHRPGDRPAVRAGHVPVRQPRRPAAGARRRALVLQCSRGRDRARGRRRVRRPRSCPTAGWCCWTPPATARTSARPRRPSPRSRRSWRA